MLRREGSRREGAGRAGWLLWTDVEVVHDSRGRPLLEVSGSVAEAAARLGVPSWHLSLSHDGGLCVAMVVAES